MTICPHCQAKQSHIVIVNLGLDNEGRPIDGIQCENCDWVIKILGVNYLSELATFLDTPDKDETDKGLNRDNH